MSIFKKLFVNKKHMANKIRIKFVSKDNIPDEHEQFLKPDVSMKIDINDDPVQKSPPVKKPPVRKSEVVKRADDEANAQRPKTVAKAPKIKITDKAKATVETEKPSTNTTNVKISAPKAAPEVKNDNPYTEGAVTVTESKSTRNGKFDIQRAKDGRFFFNLYASNHAIIAYSQIYSSTAAAMTGIKSIIANAANTPTEDTTLKKTVSHPCPKWEIYIDRAGEYRFRLYATNGNCICHSAHGYATKAGCKGGIESIGRFASDAAKIDKSYLK